MDRETVIKMVILMRFEALWLCLQLRWRERERTKWFFLSYPLLSTSIKERKIKLFCSGNLQLESICGKHGFMSFYYTYGNMLLLFPTRHRNPCQPLFNRFHSLPNTDGKTSFSLGAFACLVLQSRLIKLTN